FIKFRQKMIFPFVSVIRNSKTVLSSVLFEVDKSLTFEDLLYNTDSDYVSEEVVRVDIQVRGTNVWHMVASGLIGSLRMFSSTSNVFNEMMNAAAKKVLPYSKPSTNCNDQLHNNHKTFKLHSLKIPLLFLELPLCQNNSYYKNRTHHKTTLRRKELEFCADKLEECVLQPWASKSCWNEVITATLELCSVARIYANYLESVNQHVQRIQSASIPARSPKENSELEMRSSCAINTIQEVYFPIAERIRIANEYEIISLEEYLPETKEKRFYYLSIFAIDLTIILYRYHHGNYLGTLNFIWKISENFELRDKTKHAQAIIRTQSMLPQFFTRIRMMLELGDPEIITNMRINSGFKGTKFDEFWDEIACYFEEILLSVQERCHDNMLYLPSFISVHDLRESIIEHIENKYNEYPLSDKHLVPSDRWISYQFYNKHKIPIGEAGPTSTGVQNKKMATLTQTELLAADHNFAKLSITPSLKLYDDYFEINNPALEEEIDEFFEIIARIDTELDKSMTTMNQLQKRKLYQNFIKSHCR
ncbi:22961_t:CDS:2, partial [Gigaspora rosea]